MYDPVCKFLVENFSTDFANWLLQDPVSLSVVNPSELSLEPIRADAVVLLESASSDQKTLLHIEFQTRPDPKIPFRMLDYWVRIYRRYTSASIRQVVIYLAP
jgi:predicted transposase/invertase (TIGR01784 family)